MLKILGGVLVVFSLACIISTLVDVASGKSGLFGTDAVGPYFFHPATMLIGLALIVRKRPGEGLKGGA